MRDYRNQVNLRLEPDEADALRELALRQERTISGQARWIIGQALREEAARLAAVPKPREPG
jgi:hypothetical protein